MLIWLYDLVKRDTIQYNLVVKLLINYKGQHIGRPANRCRGQSVALQVRYGNHWHIGAIFRIHFS